MKEIKTDYGDKVAKPPNTKAVRAQVDALFEVAATALDEVAEAARRDAAIQKTSPVDVGRFPSVRRGDR